jgi:two-component system LytT family sensor kinase
MDSRFLSGDQFILVSLLVEVGFIGSLASLLVTNRFYRRLLSQPSMRAADPYKFALSFGICIALGVGARILLGYSGADLSLPGTVLSGLIAGPVAGMVVGVLVGGTALCHGEWLALPFGVVCGLFGGAISRLPSSRRELWELSPYPYVNIYRAIKTRGTRHVVPLAISVMCLSLDVTRTLATQQFGHDVLWSFQPSNGVVLAVVWIASLIALGVPLKVWNNTRLEILLKAQEELAIRARLEALTQQINPHFLFNTLNSISSATRTRPEMARHLIQKLSTIMRRVLDKRRNFVPLEEELEYIDSYLDIEVARFGTEKLRIVKDVDEDALHVLVPVMVLQPLVENAVLHAIAPLPEGGTVTIRARREGTRVNVEIGDDGVGFDASRLQLDGDQPPGSPRQGIGLANVHQRLKMAYGRGLDITAERGVGTHVRFQVPYVPTPAVLVESEKG